MKHKWRFFQWIGGTGLWFSHISCSCQRPVHFMRIQYLEG